MMNVCESLHFAEPKCAQVSLAVSVLFQVCTITGGTSARSVLLQTCTMVHFTLSGIYDVTNAPVASPTYVYKYQDYNTLHPDGL